MEGNNLSVLKISGSGSFGGGKYEEVRISGSGEIQGDVECRIFKTSGSSSIKGNLVSEVFDVSGASDIRGNVVTEDFKVSGSASVKGDLKAKYLKISGSTDVSGSVSSEEVDIKGSCSIKKDCEAENFKANGGFDIKGLLNAGNIEIRVWARCAAREIGGEKIYVRIGNDGVFVFTKMINMLFNKPAGLITDLIEGDDIYLEATKAKVVRGNNVTIGADCDIELVEFKENIKIEGNGRVKDQIKI